jgi:hypothetical protein
MRDAGMRYSRAITSVMLFSDISLLLASLLFATRP